MRKIVFLAVISAVILSCQKTKQKTSEVQERPVAILTTGTHLRSSEKEHKVNALALGADEGRDKLR